MAEQPSWKQEALRKRIERERSTDVERKWEHAIQTEGKDAPEWIREVAIKKKQQRDTLTKAGIPPWMQETQRRNSGLSKRMADAKDCAIDEDVSEREMIARRQSCA